MIHIGIIGNGFVGKAMQVFKKSGRIRVTAYDVCSDNCIPLGTTFEDILTCDIIFISVPTPMNKDGSCFTDIVKETITDIRNKSYKGEIVLRSTVPPGTCDKLQCNFMPEFLTEANARNDFIENKNWIFGIDEDTTNTAIFESLIKIAKEDNCIQFDKCTFMKRRETEMTKMMRNIYLACKVGICNELEEWCNHLGVSYDTVREVAFSDDRIGLSHTMVPGSDGKRGFGGTCFPKDISSAISSMKENGVEHIILNAVNTRNNTVDRKEKDWEHDKGRAVVS